MPGSCVASWAITGVANAADSIAAAPSIASFVIDPLRLTYDGQRRGADAVPSQRSSRRELRLHELSQPVGRNGAAYSAPGPETPGGLRPKNKNLHRGWEQLCVFHRA